MDLLIFSENFPVCLTRQMPRIRCIKRKSLVMHRIHTFCLDADLCVYKSNLCLPFSPLQEPLCKFMPNFPQSWQLLLQPIAHI